MAKIVVLAQADLSDDELKSLVDAGHDVTLLHPQKASVFALLKGLGGSLSGEEPKEEEPKEEPEEKAEGDEEAAPAEEPELPEKPVEEAGWQVFGTDVRGAYASVKEPTLFVPSLTGRYFQLSEMQVSTATTNGVHYVSAMVKTGQSERLLQLRVSQNPEARTPFLCIPA